MTQDVPKREKPQIRCLILTYTEVLHNALQMYLHHHQVVQSGDLRQYRPKQLHDASDKPEIFYRYVGGTEPEGLNKLQLLVKLFRSAYIIVKSAYELCHVHPSVHMQYLGFQ